MSTNLMQRKNALGKFLAIVCAMMAAWTIFGGVEELTGEYRNGQVFLQWKEKGLPADARLTVYGSSQAITQENLKDAEVLADLLNTGSARDWWQDVNAFQVNRSKEARSEENFAGDVADVDGKKYAQPGFVIRDNGTPIPADGGLHVHTPAPSQTGNRFYAVRCTKEEKVLGFAATSTPIDVKAGAIQPIIIDGQNWEKDCAKGLPLIIHLHGRGGGVGVDGKGNPVGTHLLFTDKSLAWREGIPVKFRAVLNKDSLQLFLNDRVWIGRTMGKDEVSDERDLVPAISTFWYGYNPNIATSIKGGDLVCDNYSERLILAITRWAQNYLGADKNRTYVRGGSMGGTGGVMLATHYPDVFAAVDLLVPIYSYTFIRSRCGGNTSIGRIFCSTGKFSKEHPALRPDGSSLMDHLNGAKIIANAEIDFPPIIACNGRRDLSMPWENCPPFFKAANNARQALIVAWNDGDHSTSQRLIPEDMKGGLDKLLRYRLDQCFPAFSNCSTNKDCGNGDFEDGDLEGWQGRGFTWSGLVDTPNRLEMSVTCSFPGIVYPVTTDITFRRRQNFKPAPGQTVKALINGQETKAVVEPNGLLTLTNVTITDDTPVKITLSL